MIMRAATGNTNIGMHAIFEEQNNPCILEIYNQTVRLLKERVSFLNKN